ncbi:hypothetical protein [Rhodococcus sp. T7]|uniref:hypothetical protein n=1 Tax=Rhodococcus sp. T7 TaxID=627444 RepID=UPI00135B7163|nr:hypothetical protein [Rhodococcus sp. T7]KAF0957679.1 hypothetical protein MLGJGCBP_09511 [Rhodococcus sp. T7]KAF0963249.1 hypothetical protein MLGJGCBP_03555 [Rhodococcus sp. T7]
MPLDDQLGRWVQRTAHVRDTLNQILSALPEHDRVLFDSTLGTVQGLLEDHLHAGDGDAPSEGSALAEVTDPFLTALREFQALTAAPDTTAGLRALLSSLRDSAQTAHLTLTTDDRLTIQSVDEVIADFAQEYRISLILALTANHALSQTVVRWQRAKDSDAATGDHLDLTTMNFASAVSDRTVPMSTLTSASAADPVVMTPSNFSRAMNTLMTGGTPPPIYQMAYTQWFTNINAAWEDTYRGRLATAHGPDDDGKPWAKNDIRSEFFNEIRLIRNDISHKRGVCVDSGNNTLIDWVEPGKPIAPTPRQMLGLLDLFPHDELRRFPTKAESNTTGQLPYPFASDWINEVRAHIEAIEPTKKKRAAVLKQLIDEWMDRTR